MFRNITLIVLSIFLSFQALAGTIKGQIKDAKTGEPLIGATILLKNTKLGASTGFDGSFQIKNIPSGEYQIEVAIFLKKHQTKKLRLKIKR